MFCEFEATISSLQHAKVRPHAENVAETIATESGDSWRSCRAQQGSFRKEPKRAALALAHLAKSRAEVCLDHNLTEKSL